MRIRQAQEDDIPALQRLLRQVLDVHVRLRPDLFLPGTTKYTPRELQKILHDPASPVLVAEDAAGEVQGYCFCEIQERRGLNNMPDGRTLYIDDLCVDANARGQHIGQRLCRAAEELAAETGCGSVTLNVWEGNDGARAFYDSMGFFVRKTMLEKRVEKPEEGGLS